MAKSNSGKWVSRVGAAGGGKTYRKTRPGNYYGILAVIVIVGLAATVYSRYEYQNPVKKHTSVVQPAVGTTLYAGLSVQSCGQTLPYLTSDPSTKLGFVLESDDVVRLSPVSSFDAGNNATLRTFASEYPGLITTSKELAIPKSTGAADPATTYKNGALCSTKSKYAGQKGKVEYAYWTSFAQKKPTIVTNPADIKFSKELRVTLAFEPAGVTPSPPAKTTADAMVYDTVTPTTTTTTTVPTTTTTKPSTTTTTASTTTTTKG
ncbi:MAG: hypothetical protein WAK12_07160 [Acidimicrobiales bacterium]